MSTTQTATTTLYVNGRPAQEEIGRLRGTLDKLKKDLQDIAKDQNQGINSPAWKKVQAEIKKTEKELDRVQSGVANVKQTMVSLDKATPKQLRKALKELKAELEGIERGSKAWDEQVKKIRSVQKELDILNGKADKQGNLWDRFAKKMFDWGAAIQTTMAAITGITMTARQAVQAYADMEGEMASVRKFTGMTADEVERLNEEFKKIDTRTSREDLNKLAQEAGRLGLQSQEDVLGFVRAADQINVALDDLGEGATLTLSKLTDIFGDKQRLGVEQSLLSVGSVINELSQNCSASAPYLAEFASRLGGVGAQAGMSIQQIMAFGAVLDSAQQNVESSATALSQLIVKLYRDPAKYAAAAGLEVKAFANLMKKDANEAVLLLLDTLNKAGGMDVLAPMFADMGEKGSRSVQTLSVLANKIDDVRKQQMAANQAFEEGTSVTNEFNVQNNTVQAGLDKAKKSFNEMAVELGQKLAPLMRYAITSGSALLKVMSTTITFVSRYKKLLLELALVMVMFNAQLVATVIQTKALATWQAICTVATKMWSAAVAVGTAAVTAFRYTIGLAAVAYIALTKGMTAARIAMAALNATLAISPMGAIVAIAAAAALAISKFRNSLKSAREEAEQARIAKEKYKKSLVDFTNQATESANKEMAALSSLYSVATSDVYTREKRIEAVQKLQKLYPVYFSHLSQEAIMAGRAATEYKALVSAIYDTAMARAAAAKIEQNAGEILDLELKRDQQMDDLRQKDAAARQARAKVSQARTARDFKQAQKESGAADAAATEASLAVGKTGMEIANRNRANQAILKKVPKAADYLTGGKTASTAPSVPYSGSTGGGVGHKNGRSSETKAQTDKLAAEKAWREKEIALAKIAWLKGETDYEQHTDRMEQIEVEYYDKILARADLSEQERLEAQGKSLEAQKKQKETAHDRTIEQENQQYAELQAVVQNDYLQGRISRQAYDMQMENIEFAHLRAMTEITKEGTDERAKAEAAYRQKLVAEQQKRQKESADKEKLHQEELKKIKEDYFGPNAAENKALYDAALKNLQQVYDAELRAAGDNAKEKLRIEKAFLAAKAALRKQFNQQDQTENQNFLQAWGQSVNDWLQSDMGKAVTGTLETVTNSMSSLFQQMSSLIQAEADIEVAAIERRYDTEISRAEGNQNKVKALERRKERETAKIKNEAARRQMSMQVIQAIAQTATAALNAYSSAAAIPVVGYILAPIAASMAVAAGMMQVAAIKKQQQAQEAQGYATGGFTPEGPADKPVGIVHAGEWVASQKLLRNPATRPAIEALDYAQRHNTMGSIRAADVSRSVTAGQVIARTTADDSAMTAMAAAMARYADTMRDLGDRLNEPFVTVNTIEGDTGIKQAQDEYQRLMNNTLPKNRRK